MRLHIWNWPKQTLQDPHLDEELGVLRRPWPSFSSRFLNTYYIYQNYLWFKTNPFRQILTGLLVTCLRKMHYFRRSKEINLADSVYHATKFHLLYERHTWRGKNPTFLWTCLDNYKILRMCAMLSRPTEYSVLSNRDFSVLYFFFSLSLWVVSTFFFFLFSNLFLNQLRLNITWS